jgi:hypothetical protein
MRKIIVSIGALCAAAFAVAGCATLRQEEARNMEQRLAAAGFQAIPADTPERRADLLAIPPHKLLEQPRDEGFAYTYADPEGCKCLYIGGPEQYSAFQRMAFEQEIASEEYAASTNWDLWGPAWWW